MKIWWGFRASQEAFLLIGMTYFFIGGGGFLFNYRKRYLIHKQKRERSKTINLHRYI